MQMASTFDHEQPFLSAPNGQRRNSPGPYIGAPAIPHRIQAPPNYHLNENYSLPQSPKPYQASTSQSFREFPHTETITNTMPHEQDHSMLDIQKVKPIANSLRQS